MFSVDQKRQISNAVQEILRATKHPELPSGEIEFLLHVNGAEPWSWAGREREERTMELRKDYFGYRVTCTVCGMAKKPWGRSAPLDSYYCDSDCPGYAQEPLPSNLWPNESEADFGYEVPR